MEGSFFLALWIFFNPFPKKPKFFYSLRERNAKGSTEKEKRKRKVTEEKMSEEEGDAGQQPSGVSVIPLELWLHIMDYLTPEELLHSVAPCCAEWKVK